MYNIHTGAVAFQLAKYADENGENLAGVIVENTFTSISAMVDHLMPFIAPLKFLVLRIGWNSATVVPNLNVPILFIMGDSDELVPSSHSLELYNLSKNAKLHTVRGGVSCCLFSLYH